MICSGNENLFDKNLGGDWLNMAVSSAVYLRVSSDMQVQTDTSISSQLLAIRKYAEAHDYFILENSIYEELGVSASSADARPSFQKMIYDAKQPDRPFHAILCYDSSRFSRSREDCIIYKSLLRKKGIELVFVKQNFDTDTVSGLLLEGICELFDEVYLRNLSIETLRGQLENARQGFLNGGSAPYGYKRVEIQNNRGARKYTLQPDKTTAPIVKEIFKRRIQGLGYRAIAYELNAKDIPSARGGEWRASSVYSILKNCDAYSGTYIFNKWNHKDEGVKFKPESEWIVVQGAWSELVSTDEVDAVKRMFGRQPRKVKHRLNTGYTLSGHLKCGICSSPLNGTSSGRKSGWKYYRCVKSRDSGSSCCNLRMLPKRLLEHALQEDFIRKFLNISSLKSLIKTSLLEHEKRRSESVTGRFEALILEKQKMEKEKQSLLKMMDLDNNDTNDIEKRLKLINNGLLSIDFNIAEISKQLNFNNNRNSINFNDIYSIIDIYKGDNSETLSLIARDFLKDIKVFNDRMEIDYHWIPEIKESDRPTEGDGPTMCKMYGAEDSYFISNLRTELRITLTGLLVNPLTR